jgi:hypothetical protein
MQQLNRDSGRAFSALFALVVIYALTAILALSSFAALLPVAGAAPHFVGRVSGSAHL